MTLCFSYPQLVVMTVFLPLFGQRLSYTARVAGALVLQAGMLAALPWAVAAMPLPEFLAVVGVLGISVSVLDASLFGFAGLLPAHYPSLLLSGNGVAGVVSCAANIVVQAAFPNDAQQAARVYFLAAAAAQLGCLGTFLWLVRHPATARYLQQRRGGGEVRAAAEADAGSESSVLSRRRDAEPLLQAHDRRRSSGSGIELEEGVAAVSGAAGFSIEGAAKAAAAAEPTNARYAGDELEARDGGEERQPLVRGADGTAAPRRREGWCLVIRTVLPSAAAVTLAFGGMFAVFPAILPYALSPDGDLGRLNLSARWWRAMLMLLTQVSDTCGRLLAARFAPAMSDALLLVSWEGARGGCCMYWRRG
jgi:hypothetical protein